MPELSLGLFVCFAIPLLVSLIFVKGKVRQSIFFILVGMVVCLFCGELNGLILKNAFIEQNNYVIFVSPFIEELFKIIPLLIYLLAFKPEKKNLVESALLLGIGFSMYENAYVLSYYGESVSIIIAILRAFGAGMMHIVTALYAGYVLTIVKEKKLFPLYALIIYVIAVSYHALFNLIGLSPAEYLIFLFPTVTFIPLVIYLVQINLLPKHRKEARHE